MSELVSLSLVLVSSSSDGGGEEAEIKKIYRFRNIYLSIYIDIDIYNTIQDT